ncbi:MAG: hypothetical protein JO107_04530 [Hyphomicrobiales bacterium]|nr:hypothetical protein [Hyphomicrobiales bacterium]
MDLGKVLLSLAVALGLCGDSGGDSPLPPRGRRTHAIPGAAAALAFVWLGQAAAMAQQAPMTFRAAILESPECGTRCPEVIVADGVIEEDTPRAFLDFTRQVAASPRLHSVILLNSPGGNVVASMELGTAFRELNAAAIVAGYASVGGRTGAVSGRCLSACVYALIGATRRVVPRTSVVGLHRMSVVEGLDGPEPGRRTLADPELVAALASYAARMGVDPALIRRAESLTPGVLHFLSRAEIVHWRLAQPRM